MQLRALGLLATVLSLTGFACEKAPTADTAAEEQAIRDRVKQWNDYLAARNDSAIAGLYTADAVMLPPNEATVTSPAIRQYWAELWPLNSTLVLTPVAIQVTQPGDLAIEEGTWTFSATVPTGPVSDNGKYLTVWTKVNGEWKVAKEIWNSSNPAPGMPMDSTAAR